MGNIKYKLAFLSEPVFFWYKSKITNLPPENWLKGKLKQYKVAFPSCYRQPNEASAIAHVKVSSTDCGRSSLTLWSSLTLLIRATYSVRVTAAGWQVWLVILMLILQFSLDVTGVDLLQPLNQVSTACLQWCSETARDGAVWRCMCWLETLHVLPPLHLLHLLHQLPRHLTCHLTCHVASLPRPNTFMNFCRYKPPKKMIIERGLLKDDYWKRIIDIWIQALGRIMAIVFPIRMQLRVGANKIDWRFQQGTKNARKKATRSVKSLMVGTRVKLLMLLVHHHSHIHK